MASQVSKLNYVDSKLGAPTSGQQTTRIIYNTVTSPSGSSVEFFKTFQGLTLGQTNLTQSKLDSSESMVIKSIWFAQYNATGLVTFGLNSNVTCSIVVGNQTVVKDLPLSFNAGFSGQAFDRLHESGGTLGQFVNTLPFAQGYMPTEVRLLTDIVIPPQTDFYVRVDAPNGSFDDSRVICALSGYGKIFSAGSSF